MAIYKEIVEKNYTVVGTPTVSDGVASGFSTSDYLIADTAFPSSGVCSILVKVSIDSSYSKNVCFISKQSVDRALYVQSKSGCFSFYDGTSRVSSTPATVGKSYWIKYTINSSNKASSLAVILDNNYTEETLPSSGWDTVSWTSSENTYANEKLLIGNNKVESTPFNCGSVYLETLSYFQNEEKVWTASRTYTKDVSGSVNVSKGYYSDGTNEIILPSKDYNIDALTNGQSIACKNKLYVYKNSSNDCGALITSTMPAGSFKVTKDLEHPIYLSNLKNYIAGDTLQMGEVTFSNADAEIWVQPILTSATSYGTVTDSRKSTNEAGWKALDGDSSTQYVPGTGTAWWKWELPEYLIFTPESSITWTHRNNPETFKGTMCRFFADETMSIRLTPDFTDTSSSLSSVTVPCSDITEPVTTNVIYWTKDSGGSWGGASSITFNNVYKGAAVFSGVSIGKTLKYSESQDKTYWIPKTISVPLSDIASTQSVGTVNRLYLTLKGDETSISFSNNGVINGVDSYMATSLNVYLSDDLTTILTIGE